MFVIIQAERYYVLNFEVNQLYFFGIDQAHAHFIEGRAFLRQIYAKSYVCTKLQANPFRNFIFVIGGNFFKLQRSTFRVSKNLR